MDAVLKNQLQQLSYEDPEEALKNLFAPLHVFALATPPMKGVQDWWHHKLRKYRESEQAAWLAYALKKAGIKPDLKYAHYPKTDTDFDAAVCWSAADALEFATVQLKEVVGSDLNLGATLQAEIDKFARYDGAEELIGAVFVNRDLTFDPSTLRIPRLKLRKFWIYGLSGSGGGRVELYGDLLRAPQRYAVPLPDFRWKDRSDLPWA